MGLFPGEERLTGVLGPLPELKLVDPIHLHLLIDPVGSQMLHNLPAIRAELNLLRAFSQCIEHLEQFFLRAAAIAGHTGTPSANW